MTQINKRLLVKAGAVASAALGPTLSPLGVDVKKLVPEINKITQGFDGKVFVNVAISESRQTEVTLLPLTDAYRLKQFKKVPATFEQNLRKLAEETLDKSFSRSIDARILELRGIANSITS